MGDEQIRIDANTGVVATGDHTSISQTAFHAPEAGVPAAGQADCPPGTVHLGGGRHSGLFVGRQDELDEIDTAVASGAVVVTTGLGGVGKSTLVREYARRHRDRYNPIWWIAAEDPTEIEAGLSALARRLCQGLALLPDEAASAWARTWLAAHGGWLLLDNITEPAHVDALISDLPGGRFLLTSRVTVGWHGIATATRLGVFTDDQALELMVRIAGSTLMDGAEQLCQVLGNLPLAIEQAAAYMNQNQVSAAVFYQRLTAGSGRVLDWAPNGTNAERTIARIWQVSLQTITDRYGELPGRLLNILAWYAPDDIPVAVLHHLHDGIDAQQIDEALGRLAAYALVTRTGDAIAVHRLVQTVAQAFPDHTSTPRTQAPDPVSAEAARALLHVIPEQWEQPAAWPTWGDRQTDAPPGCRSRRFGGRRAVNGSTT